MKEFTGWLLTLQVVMSNFDIEKIKRKTLVKYKLFNRIIANVEIVLEKGVATAGTDGKKLYFNPEFMSSKSESEQEFIFAHEIFHIAFDHIKRGTQKNKQVWNICTDGVTNNTLVKDGLKAPDDAIFIEDAELYDAEELYDKMMKKREENQSDGNDDKDSADETPNFDNHDIWKQMDDKRLSNEPQNSQTELEKAVEELSTLGEKKAFEENDKLVQEELKREIQKISQEKISHGDDSKVGNLEVNNVGMAKNLVDWRRYLKEAVNLDVDWSYQNAEVENGVLTPHLVEIPSSEAEIVLDTSGSINIELLKCFLRECKNILKNARIKAGCFDVSFYGFNDIKTDDDINNLPFKGGGGTDFNAAVNAFSKRVENKIIFTDGLAAMPDKPIDAIWVVFGNHKINPKGGKVIYVDENQLRRTYGALGYEQKGKTR